MFRIKERKNANDELKAHYVCLYMLGAMYSLQKTISWRLYNLGATLLSLHNKPLTKLERVNGINFCGSPSAIVRGTWNCVFY